MAWKMLVKLSFIASSANGFVEFAPDAHVPLLVSL